MLDGRIRRGLALVAPSAGVLSLAAAGVAFDPYVKYVVGLCLVAALMGAALVPLVGLARIVMLAGGAMAGIGAYASSLLILKAGLPFLAAVGVSAIVGALAGFLLGLPAIRFRSHHLAMVTLVFQALGIIIIREWKSMTGGAEGMRVPPAVIFGFEFRSDESNLALLGIACAICVLIVTILVRGSFGKVLRAIASTEVGAAAFGVNLGAYKVAAFTVSCAFLAIAGALLAPRLKIIDPDSFGIMQSINALAYPIVGGMTSIWGGVLGGGLLRALPEALRAFKDYSELIYTALAVVMVLVLPGGLVSGIERAAARLRAAGAGAGAVTVTDISWTPAAVATPLVVRRTVGSNPPAVEVLGVTKNFGSLAAVSNVSLAVQDGSIHGLIGPNGAGKTTLFNMLSGFIDADAGDIRLLGARTRNAPARRRIRMGVARTFQHVAIYDQLSVLDNVLIGLGDNGVFRTLYRCASEAMHGATARRRENLANAALDVVGLFPRRHERAGALALGDQRRLEIARAIASQPKLLLLDEPVSGVAIEEERNLKDLLHKLNKEWSLSMLLIEHNIRFVVDCCSSLSVMHQGVIVAEGDPAQVIARQNVQQIYFGKV